MPHPAVSEAGPPAASACGLLCGGCLAIRTGGRLHVVGGCRLLHVCVLRAGLAGRQCRRPSAYPPPSPPPPA
eukprot:6935823-Prymnesium_polylepis.1